MSLVSSSSPWVFLVPIFNFSSVVDPDINYVHACFISLVSVLRAINYKRKFWYSIRGKEVVTPFFYLISLIKEDVGREYMR